MLKRRLRSWISVTKHDFKRIWRSEWLISGGDVTIEEVISFDLAANLVTTLNMSLISEVRAGTRVKADGAMNNGFSLAVWS